MFAQQTLQESKPAVVVPCGCLRLVPPHPHATLGWTYSPLERLETSGGFGLGSDRITLSRIWHLRFCDRLRLSGGFDFRRLNERINGKI